MSMSVVFSMGSDQDEPRRAQPARCGKCSHVWTVAYVPMDLTVFCRIIRVARCPMCGSRNAYLVETAGNPPNPPIDAPDASQAPQAPSLPESDTWRQLQGDELAHAAQDELPSPAALATALDPATCSHNWQSHCTRCGTVADMPRQIPPGWHHSPGDY